MYSSIIGIDPRDKNAKSTIIEDPDAAKSSTENEGPVLGVFKKIWSWSGNVAALDHVQRAEAKVGKIAVSARYHKGNARTVDDDYLQTTKILGTGYNGVVRMAESRGTMNKETKYAVKSLRLNRATEEQTQRLKREMEIFLMLDHPRIARLFDVYESEDRLDLVMECMEGGELFDRVAKLQIFSEKEAASTVWQMLYAVSYIHSNGIVHRDIKMENFLYAKKDGYLLKLIDFGFSKGWDPNSKHRMGLTCGTLSYMAPEVLLKCYGSQCDLWSLGVVTFVLLQGHMPFNGSDDTQMKNIALGKYETRPESWDSISDQARDFVTSLLQADPEKRLTAQQALKHEWINKSSNQREIDSSVLHGLRLFSRGSRFRRCCMQMMAWSLSYDDRLKVSHYFTYLDLYKDGIVTLEEMQRVLREKLQVPEEETKEIFRAMDLKGHGEIHYSDFLAAMVSTMIELQDDLLRATFRKFDRDCSGYITTNNLYEVLGDKFDGLKVGYMLSELDLTRADQMSYQEFEHYLRAHPEETKKAASKGSLGSRWLACLPCCRV